MKSGKGKPPSLKGIYYRTFVSLVAIPLLMVFIGTMFVINHQIRKASLENISTFQEGLADTLKQEIDENSLQMAHFVYSQDGYFCSWQKVWHPQKAPYNTNITTNWPRDFRWPWCLLRIL